MAQEFRLPDIGEGLTDAEVVRWLVEVGDPIGIDQPLVEVETAKAVTDIPSPYAGVVLHLGAQEGSTINVGEILVVVGYAGERWIPEDDQDEAPEAAPIVGTLNERAEMLGTSAGAEGEEVDRPKALPLVRRLAKEQGIDLASVHGTGPHGRITRDDVLAAAGLPTSRPVFEPSNREVELESPVDSIPEDQANEQAAEPDGDVERVRMSRLRRTIAERVSRSWAEIPHVTAFDQADATRLLAARKALERRSDGTMPLEVLIVKAVLPAIIAFPEFNASIDGDDLVLNRFYNVGVAVDTPEGLIVPVIRDAADLSVSDMAGEILRLAAGAQERVLETPDLTGATFTVSNIGAVGGGMGTPIVPYGTTAILSVGRAEEQAVVRDGRVEVAPMLPLSLSYDHRAIDGGLGRRFLAMVIENLEEPALFLAE